jgi:hypothetical protein
VSRGPAAAVGVKERGAWSPPERMNPVPPPMGVWGVREAPPSLGEDARVAVTASILAAAL